MGGANGKLFKAAKGNDPEGVHAAVAAGADVNYSHQPEGTALVVAAENGNYNAVQALIECGANLESTSCYGALTPLHKAVMGPRYNKANFVGVVTLLIQSGANLEAVSGIKRETPLIIAADRRKTNLLRQLINAGANVDAQNKDGDTALHIAVRHPYPNVVKMLLGACASLEIRNRRGQTPADTGRANFRRKAKKCKHRPVVDLLDEHQARSECLWLAIDEEDGAKVRAALEAGANVEVKDHRQATPLFVAAREGMGPVVSVLIAHGAHLDFVGMGPLHAAAQRGHRAIVNELLSSGALVDGVPPSSETPLKLAAHTGHIQVAVDLVNFGADVNVQDARGKGPLHVAAALGNLEMVRMLVSAGADPDLPSNGGTPWELAVANGFDHVAAAMGGGVKGRATPGLAFGALPVAVDYAEPPPSYDMIEAGHAAAVASTSTADPVASAPPATAAGAPMVPYHDGTAAPVEATAPPVTPTSYTNDGAPSTVATAAVPTVAVPTAPVSFTLGALPSPVMASVPAGSGMTPPMPTAPVSYTATGTWNRATHTQMAAPVVAISPSSSSAVVVGAPPPRSTGPVPFNQPGVTPMAAPLAVVASPTAPPSSHAAPPAATAAVAVAEPSPPPSYDLHEALDALPTAPTDLPPVADAAPERRQVPVFTL